ncbi:dynein light chain-like protein [Leptotrombidium deliense]|uniref:Dynein light chain n=1 Tax=Leptotrombidium deliense TaxID=299467 RepID=A0A443SGE7_9ACAR|nr:dynein light chain-like protein [Leptotrombidium deliense]
MTESSAFEDELDEENVKVEAAEMPTAMQRIAITSTLQACRVHKTEKHIAESVKQKFDEQFGPSWHCIVGKNWGSCVTHSKQCYIRLLYKKLTILIYKSM